MAKVSAQQMEKMQIPLTKTQIVKDYRIAYVSRQASLIGRKEVLTGKAKFGIFGDGKEVAQVALCHAFEKGDFRSGYYRDQTIMFALGLSNVQEFFAQLYAHTSLEAEPSSAGRSMNGHFSSRSLNEDGSWKNLKQQYNSSADVSPTASQMPRLVGLGYASVLYRQIDELQEWSGAKNFSDKGNEVAFGTIGNASCAEGMFWEAINAIGVLKAPVVMSIWDDGYGISVPNEFQVTKSDVGELLRGFERTPGSTNGFDIYVVKGWDYPALFDAYQKAAKTAREEHVPSIIHVIEVTQPQGHSTSGSHERYKTKERLAWEDEFDPIRKMKEWMLASGIATEKEFEEWEAEEKEAAKKMQKAAWDAYLTPIKTEIKKVAGIFSEMQNETSVANEIQKISSELTSIKEPFWRDIFIAIRKALVLTRTENFPSREKLREWKNAEAIIKQDQFSSALHSESAESALKVTEVKPVYSESSPTLSGFEVMNRYFDYLFTNDPRVIAFGEDVGHIGDVNQGFAGLQAKFGKHRVSDTGIREVTIMGQAIGLAMRGLRPIAEIHYLDYLLYGLQILSDDLATVQYRTKGGQKAPLIVRTRGHRLEGIWHSGSPMSAVIGLLRGIHICVPRNFVQAAGMYNTLMKSDEPGLIVEVLNGYRLKEILPDNMGEYTVPLGQAEVLRQGTDITIVTYGPLCRIAAEAAQTLDDCGISCEIIDVQTLLPFDIHGTILDSLKKTNRILFLDEDVPGGVTAYMLQEVLENQGGYYFLDSQPHTLTAKAHRPAYGSDGDYWSKPSAEDIFEKIYSIMQEVEPGRYLGRL